MLASADLVRVAVDGVVSSEAHVAPTLFHRDAAGAPAGVAAIVVQLPASVLPSGERDVVVHLTGSGPAPAANIVPFAEVSAPASEVVTVAERTIVNSGGKYTLSTVSTKERVLFDAREPLVIATFAEGYLGKTGVIGPVLPAADVAADASFAGTRAVSDALLPFALSAMYEPGYAVHPDSITDPVENYEGWLYDRCATFLVAHAHTGDTRVLRHAIRSCAYYQAHIDQSGIFTGKSSPDAKYSHLRGLYAYYALTGDEGAVTAAERIATMWLSGEGSFFVSAYRAGKLTLSNDPDRLWTERLLGTSLEGLIYGHRMTGDATFLAAAQEMVATAHTHIVGDKASLATINPFNDFPPQDCFIHNAAQHAEGEVSEPWCSGWMSELVVDALLRHQEASDDKRVDDIFVRLARFLRDTGSSYLDGDLLDDTFLQPSTCASDGRLLVPLYGAGRDAAGARLGFGDGSDVEHCADATALTAAALRALARQGQLEKGPVGPFASEGASLVSLHRELSRCASTTFDDWTRLQRAPSAWDSDALAAGASDPAGFIAANKIGYPTHPTTPLRKLSWWFNVSMLQYGLLRDAKVAIPEQVQKVQPQGCP